MGVEAGQAAGAGLETVPQVDHLPPLDVELPEQVGLVPGQTLLHPVRQGDAPGAAERDPQVVPPPRAVLAIAAAQHQPRLTQSCFWLSNFVSMRLVMLAAAGRHAGGVACVHGHGLGACLAGCLARCAGGGCGAGRGRL